MGHYPRTTVVGLETHLTQHTDSISTSFSAKDNYKTKNHFSNHQLPDQKKNVLCEQQKVQQSSNDHCIHTAWDASETVPYSLCSALLLTRANEALHREQGCSFGTKPINQTVFIHSLTSVMGTVSLLWMCLSESDYE